MCRKVFSRDASIVVMTVAAADVMFASLFDVSAVHQLMSGERPSQVLLCTWSRTKLATSALAIVPP